MRRLNGYVVPSALLSASSLQNGGAHKPMGAGRRNSDEDVFIAIFKRKIIQIGVVLMAGLCMQGLERLSMFQGMTSIDGGYRGLVFGIRRFVLAFAVVSAFLLFFPQQGLAKYRDPYEFTTLTGGVRLIYTKGRNSNKGMISETKNSYNGFRQIYSLSMRGKFISRRLVVYNFGVVHTKNVVKNIRDSTATGTSTASTDKNNITEYHFSTTLIPKSAIPLTLHTRRITDKKEGTSQSSSVTKAYGLNWSFNFMTLPKAHLSYDNSKTTATQGDSSMKQYRARVSKDIGVTTNTFNAVKTNNGASSGGKTSAASATNLGYENKTSFSKRTDMTANVAKNITTNTANTGFDGTFVNMRLYSTPGPDFTQRHLYYYSLTKGKSALENSSYAGSIRYRLTDRLSTALSLTNNTHMQDDAAKKLRSSNMTTTGNTRYMLTRRLTWRVDGSYAHGRSNAANADTTGANWAKYRLATGLGYKRIFKLFTLGMSGDTGYVAENVGAKGSKTYKERRGATYALSLSLSRIRLWNYAMMNTLYQYSQSKESLSKSFNNVRLYNASIMNIAGRKYALVSANYSRKSQDSWSVAYYERKESYGGSVGTSDRYFNKSEAELTVNWDKVYTAATGNMLSNRTTAKAGTRRSTSLGETTVGVDLARSKSSDVEGKSTTSSSVYSLTLAQQLAFIRQTGLGLNIRRFRNSTNNELLEFNDETTLEINHNRPVLGGAFSADYSYRIAKRRYLSDYEAHNTHLLKSRFSRALLGGDFSANYSFNTTTGTYLKKQEQYTIHEAETTFSKPISRNLSLELYALMSRANGTFAYIEAPSVTELKSTLHYAFRSWMFSAQYSDRVAKYMREKITDNRIMFSLGRGFVRMW